MKPRQKQCARWVLIVMAATGLYVGVGGWSKVAERHALQETSRIMVAALNQANPSHPEPLWRELNTLAHDTRYSSVIEKVAEVFVRLGQHTQALALYESAMKRFPDETTQWQLRWLNAAFLAHQGQMQPSFDTIIYQILQKNPEHPEALNLKAIAAFQNKKPQEAKALWGHLIQNTDNEALCDRWRQLMAQTDHKYPEEQGHVLEVSWSESVQNHVSQFTPATWFMILREEAGQGVPLAAARLDAQASGGNMLLGEPHLLSAHWPKNAWLEVRCVAGTQAHDPVIWRSAPEYLEFASEGSTLSLSRNLKEGTMP